MIQSQNSVRIGHLSEHSGLNQNLSPEQARKTVWNAVKSAGNERLKKTAWNISNTGPASRISEKRLLSPFPCLDSNDHPLFPFSAFQIRWPGKLQSDPAIGISKKAITLKTFSFYDMLKPVFCLSSPECRIIQRLKSLPDHVNVNGRHQLNAVFKSCRILISKPFPAHSSLNRSFQNQSQFHKWAACFQFAWRTALFSDCLQFQFFFSCIVFMQQFSLFIFAGQFVKFLLSVLLLIYKAVCGVLFHLFRFSSLKSFSALLVCFWNPAFWQVRSLLTGFSGSVQFTAFFDFSGFYRFSGFFQLLPAFFWLLSPFCIPPGKIWNRLTACKSIPGASPFLP